jgi:hypothetical protein
MIRPIAINAVANGWTVTVGCQTLVFTNVQVMAAELVAYLTDPDGTEKRYLSEAVNIRHTNGAPAPPPWRDPEGPQNATERSAQTNQWRTRVSLGDIGNAASTGTGAYDPAAVTRR